MEEVKMETLEVAPEAEENKKTVKLRTKFDYRTMKYLNLYVMKYKKKTFFLYGIMVGVALGAGIYMFLISEGKNNYLWPIVFGLVIIYTIYQALNIEKNLDKHLKNYFSNRPVVDQIIEISSDKITVSISTNPDEKADYDWAYIGEIDEIPQYYFLFLNGNTPIILDKREEALEEGTLEDLKEIIAEKAELKPYKLLDKEIVKRPIDYVHQEIQVVDEHEQKDAVEAEVSEVETVETEENKEEN